MRILICDSIDRKGIELLRSAGFEVEEKLGLGQDELTKVIKGFDAIIVRSRTKVTRSVVEAADRLKIIGRAGVGVDNIDIEAAKEMGIKVVTTPEAASNSVAELVFGLIICLLRGIHVGNSALKEGKWIKHELMGAELRGKTIGVIGLGRIGSRVALIAKAFGMRVVGYDVVEVERKCEELGIEAARDIYDLLSRSDMITIHVPLTSETYRMIGRKELERMRRGIYIINTSRGGVIDGRELLRALEEGKVGGAALDVFEHEPPEEDWEWELIRHPKVIATPHIGSMTREAQELSSLLLAEKLIEEFRESGR